MAKTFTFRVREVITNYTSITAETAEEAWQKMDEFMQTDEAYWLMTKNVPSDEVEWEITDYKEEE